MYITDTVREIVTVRLPKMPPFLLINKESMLSEPITGGATPSALICRSRVHRKYRATVSCFSGLNPIAQRTGVVHLDVLKNARYLCIGRMIVSEAYRTEMARLPLFPSIRICRPLQRDRKPQGQYGNYTVTTMSLATQTRDRTQGRRTFRMFLAREAEIVISSCHCST